MNEKGESSFCPSCEQFAPTYLDPGCGACRISLRRSKQGFILILPEKRRAGVPVNTANWTLGWTPLARTAAEKYCKAENQGMDGYHPLSRRWLNLHPCELARKCNIWDPGKTTTSRRSMVFSSRPVRACSSAINSPLETSSIILIVV